MIWVVKTFAATHSLQRRTLSVGFPLIAIEPHVWWDEAAAGCYGCCVSSIRLSSDCRHSAVAKTAYTRTTRQEQRGDMEERKETHLRPPW